MHWTKNRPVCTGHKDSINMYMVIVIYKIRKCIRNIGTCIRFVLQNVYKRTISHS